VCLILGTGNAAGFRRVVAVFSLDRGTVAGLVSVRTVGVRRWFGGGRLRLDSSRYELITRGAALLAEI